MASSRLEKIGTIYSRVTGLLRSGAMKFEDKPMWYTIYQSFPPKYAPKYDRPAPNVELKKIFYEEDKIRAKFHKKYPKHSGIINLNDTKNKTNTQTCIETFQELQPTMEDEAIFETVAHNIEAKLASNKVHSESDSKTKVTSLAQSFKTAQINMKDIMKE